MAEYNSVRTKCINVIYCRKHNIRAIKDEGGKANGLKVIYWFHYGAVEVLKEEIRIYKHTHFGFLCVLANASGK